MDLNRYNLEARFLPAIIASIPFLIMYFFFLDSQLGDLFKLIFGIKWVGDISTMAAFLFLLAFIGRFIAKDIFEKRWFKGDETCMPTTEFLLYSDKEYSDQFKEKIRLKIKKDFKIDIPSADAEFKNEYGARKIIAEAVGLIRNALKDGRLLIDRNIEYGFIRNLIGCAVIAVFISILNIVIFSIIQHNRLAFITSVVIVIIYAMPIIFSKIIIKAHGRRYARTLFQEYAGS